MHCAKAIQLNLEILELLNHAKEKEKQMPVILVPVKLYRVNLILLLYLKRVGN